MKTSKDTEMRQLKETVLEGWPEHKTKVHLLVRSYWESRYEILIDDGIIYKSDKIIVPQALR